MNSQPGDEPTANSSITFRPVSEEEKDFLLELYASTRANEMALVPWSLEQRQDFLRMQFEAQQNHYQQKYPTASHDLIVQDGRPVGQLHVARLENEIRIIDLTVTPAARNSGIGSYSIKGLMDEARSTGKLLRIYVEEFNPSARLFERLGFAAVDQQGIHVLLEWSGAPTGTPVP